MNKSKAYLKVEEYRDAIHAEKTKVLSKDLSTVFYLFESDGSPAAVAYKGRSKKSLWKYRFNNEEQRATKIDETIERFKPTPRKQTQRDLEVGDVLTASWGYEQTNIDHYLVTKLIGKTMVEIVEIGAHRVPTLNMQGESTPDPDTIIGEPMRRKAQGDWVKINSSAYARKESYEVVDGKRVYKSRSWTAYH